MEKRFKMMPFCWMVVMLCLVFFGLPGSSKAQKGTIYIDIGGAGSGGRWFMEATAIAALLTTKIPEVVASPRVIPAGGAGNIAHMDADNLEIGVACADEAWSAYYGLAPYYEDDKKAVSLWFKQNPTFITIVADKSIKAVEDLRGKRIGLGLPGTIENIQARNLLDLHGLGAKDYTALELGREASLNELIDGRVHAVINGLSRDNPNHQGRALAARGTLHLLSLDRQKAEAFVEEYPYFAVDDIGDPNLRFPGVIRIATPMYRIMNPRLDDDLVYKLTKTFWENIDSVYEELRWYKTEGVTIEYATSDVEIPFHPGAERYYREVGVIN